MGVNSDPVTLNKYLYANSDPVTYTDPTGNFSMGSVMGAVNIVGTLSSVGYASYDITSMFVSGSEEITAKDVGGAILLGLIGNKILKPIAKLCKSKGKTDNRCKLAIATIEAESKMHALVARTPNSRLNSKKSGTFTVAVVAPVIDIKRGRGTAAFNGPINSVQNSSQLRTHAAKFGIHIGQRGACGTRNTVGRCAEWRAANNLLKSGSKIKNLRWLPAHRVRKGPGGFAKVGPIIPPCGICENF